MWWTARKRQRAGAVQDAGALNDRERRSIRILPDPIAFFSIFRAVFIQHDLPAIVRFIPADGIEQKFSILRAAIVQWVATNNIVRELFDELKGERVKRFGIFAVCEVITLQRTGNERFVHCRLISPDSLRCFEKKRHGGGG